MSARRLEEIFEECVTAYLEGRRSVEESLSRYPAYAAELAPLLQTAIQLSASFQRVNPPVQVQERGRQRFLADARARRQVLTMGGAPQRMGFFASLWERHNFGFAAAGGAVAVLVLAVGSVAMLTNGSSGGGDGFAGNLTTPAQTQRATPASVLNINQAITNINTKIQAKQPVQAEDITALTQATNELSSVPAEEVRQAREQVQQALTNADSLLANIVATQPQVAPQAQQAQNTVRDVAGGLAIAIPSNTPAVTATPVPSGETATPAPTQATVTDTPAPTAKPTPAPTAVPTPSPTPVERGLPGGDIPS